MVFKAHHRFLKKQCFPKVVYDFRWHQGMVFTRCTDQTLTNIESHRKKIFPFSSLFHSSDYIKEKVPLGCWCILILVSSVQFSSVHFSRSVVSDSLRPHESQHARPPCPSPSPGVHSDSHPLSLWCHPAISSSVVPFSSCPQSLPASESFPMSQLFKWGG